MDERAGVRKKLERSVGKLPDLVWENISVQELVDEYLTERNDARREEVWGFLLWVAEDRMQLVEAAKAEALEGVKAGVSGGNGAVRETPPREQGGGGGRLEPDSFIRPVTTAMVRAMSEFFAGRAHQYHKVIEFRDKVLPGRFLTEDEAHALIASYATRVLPFKKFAEWGIPVVGHRAEVLNRANGDQFDPLDHWTTIRVDPPGITKTVRYAYLREEDPDTWYFVQGGTVVPIITGLPIKPHDDHVYPSWLWPGSVVDELYELSVELADAFDWPETTTAPLWRPRNEKAARFILTGEAPEVHPIDARWELKSGIRYQNPQWRIQLTIPPWLSEKEILQAYRQIRRQIPGEGKLPKKPTTLEVARFVWEQERQEGYKRRRWDSLREQWNEEHPGYRFETYNEFRKYFARGAKAVKELNFSWPRPSDE